MSDLPPGFELDPLPKAKQPASPVAPVGTPYTATGRVVDGDTFGLTNGSNARLFGVDAFETGQPGFRPDGTRVDLGSLSLGALASYLRPSQTVLGTGKQTYGRPVVTLGNGPTDPVRQSLLSGTALAAPEYLTADPARRARYMEDERLSRLNRQGAHQTQYMTPDAYRSAKRWGLKLRPDEEMVWTNDLPELRPEFQRLSDAEEQDYFRFLASRSGDQNFGQGDLDAYWKGKGRIAQQADTKFLDAIRKGERIGALDYSSWDAATLADFKKQNAFAGMRPEVQDAYGSILSDPNSNADTLAQFAKVNGMTFDPRDVSAYFAARAKGETAPIPLPIINPGDGRSGAFGRGFADPFGFLDEMGGAVDAVAPEWLQGAVGGPTNRETVWNSDRSFGDIYENNTRQNRAIIDYDETHHPWWRLGGQATSGFALPYGGGVRSLGGLAKLGAAEGAVYGFGSGDGTLAQRLANVPANATIGAITAPAAGAIINKGSEVLFPTLQYAAQRFARTRNGATEALAAPSVGGARDAAGLPDGFMLDEPLTLGQASSRPRDRLTIEPGAADTLPLPALGERVPSGNPGSKIGGGRDRSWIDIGAQPAPSGGTLLEQVKATSQRLGDTMGRQRADMVGDGLPSLSSPRLRDVIDVTANPTSRLMDDARTYGLMRQNAARVQPGDVLPRPANEVQSLDEFGRISEGLYPDVRAPNERDLLTSRQFPSRANPDNMLNRKGPLDLAAFVRSQGGVADFRGELKAAGLSNAARKGDDFAGGENRLGPLLNDESGATLDDMAQRAWESGYFPDHAERPTIDEFVTALGDTYRGVNRTFRPDDFNEIDAFNAARDQRQAVERARQEGAPLADDMGQPATYDDMVANTPPATISPRWRTA